MGGSSGRLVESLRACHDLDAIDRRGSAMSSEPQPVRVLVVAHKTAATPALIEAVRERARRSPAHFTLLVPNPAHGLHAVVDPEDQEDSEGQAVLELAI